jgi:eukaryotic-like serine/threonine-protein kinase
MPDKTINRRIPYFGDFVLFDEIGRGGMGVVYNAQQTKLDRPVALKVLHSGMASGTAGLQRLRIEAEAAAKLDHPNIVPIYEFGEHEGHPYLAMQLIEGESLAEYVERTGEGLDEREAAQLLSKMARAVHHAHQRGVLHRDLKPGNILLDADGEPHLIDFGLAKCLEADTRVTQTGAFMGTPAFASPEQAAGQNKSITTATDVYSLGAVLYTILAGQPPFGGDSTAAIVEQVKNATPRSLRNFRPRLHRNLEVICLKCLEKEPLRRYGSALELAEDLERFLAGRPITARAVGPLERFGMWVQRHPVHAALWGTGLLVVILSLAGIIFWRDTRTKESEARHHIHQRQLLEEIQTIRLTERAPGWSARAWERAIEAARIPTTVKSDEVRNQAAALLAGLDARRSQHFTNFGASAVLFDRAGMRLLMGGLGDGAKLWDATTGKLQSATGTNLGPVAFLADGTATQLLYDEGGHSLVLAGVENSQPVSEWKLSSSMSSQSNRLETLKHAVLTPDGAMCVVVLKTVEGRERVVVLSANTPRTLGNPLAVSAVAVSTDGSLVAIAESAGKVSVWNTHDGTRIAGFMASRNEINSLALQQTVRVPEIRERRTNGGTLLAVGDAGGVVTIWDLHSHTANAYCRGGHYQVFAVAFSSDGMTLASGGRGPVKLWDVSTGRLLLDLPTGDYITGLNFSPDGKRLAVASEGITYPANVSIWELEFARGIQTLRGLSGQISKICFSEDGSRFAALSHNWEIGVWDLAGGKLLRIFETPKGEFADNAALTLDPNGSRLAMAAQSAATLWDVQTGSNLASWELPPGLVNVMGFPGPEHLLLFRVETLDAKTPPFSNAHPTNHPRVCRIRDLLRPEAVKPLAEISDFNWHIFTARAPLDARRFVVEGIITKNSKKEHWFKCFDGFTGREFWGIPSARDGQSAMLALDPLGKIVAFQRDKSPTTTLVEMMSGAVWKTLNSHPSALHWEPCLYTVDGFPGGNGRGISILDDSRPTSLITLGLDGVTIGPVSFDATGTQLGWGNPDGTATVCNLKQIHDRLGQADLAW